MTRLTGVMGGMFDPVHNGHLQAAQAARVCCNLDEVILVPCGNPVHRPDAMMPARQRCDMLQLAIETMEWLSLDTRESNSAAPSRTYDTLVSLHKDRPDEILYCILGMDAFLAFSSWYRWKEIFTLAHLIIITRPGYDLETCKSNRELQEELTRRIVTHGLQQVPGKSGSIHIASAATPALSSSSVRKYLHEGKQVRDHLPPKVADYIEAHQLYR